MEKRAGVQAKQERRFNSPRHGAEAGCPLRIAAHGPMKDASPAALDPRMSHNDPTFPPTTAELLRPDAGGLARAAQLLRGGALVAFPTETVYGLGGLATDQRAAQAIYGAKGRPSFNPLIVHIADPADAARWAVLSPVAAALAQAFWPGPLTLVLPLRPGTGIARAVTAGGASIALRCPAHPLARALLAAVGAPVAAPSANPSGGVSPTTAGHVAAGLGHRIDAILDGGPCAVGVESTIVAVDDRGVRLLRPGGVTAEALDAALGGGLLDAAGALVFGASGHAPAANIAPIVPSASPEAPGQLLSHYAPGAAVRLNADAPRPGEGWLGFGPDPVGADDGPHVNLSPAGDVAHAAAALFAALRELDAAMGGAGTIAVAPIPDCGLGRAINDRLRRAAAPRGEHHVRP
ncbi:MAG: L-threonylcarbamoyladenylate synthase [Paracoccaceae bacterium]|jgi:L-threonylcarbamoyladenylate synthase